MTAGHWRILTLCLLLVNATLLTWFVLWPRGEPVVLERELPPLDARLPLLELVAEVTEAERSLVGGERCYSVGPLSSSDLQERARQHLGPIAISLRERQTTADTELGWTVYLPAASRAEATSLTRDLQARGEEDFFIITSGPLENMVSVGLFENVVNARARQARIQSLGFEARVEVRRESVPQYWIDYRIGADDTSPWRLIVRASPGSQHREILCWDE